MYVVGANVKLQIIFTDRVGIVANVATVMAEQAANIVSMEVEVEGDKAIVYVEAGIDEAIDRDNLLDSLRTISNFEKISVIQTLPQEKREKRFQVVLDSISDGILAIDEEGKVTIINRVAQEILNCDPGEVTGADIRDLRPYRYRHPGVPGRQDLSQRKKRSDHREGTLPVPRHRQTHQGLTGAHRRRG